MPRRQYTRREKAPVFDMQGKPERFRLYAFWNTNLDIFAPSPDVQWAKMWEEWQAKHALERDSCTPTQ